MAEKTDAAIAIEIAANITDNSNKENTAARVREILNDLNDSKLNKVAVAGTALLYEVLLSQNAPVASQTSGTVVAGQVWTITTYAAGDDFSNWVLISGTANTTGAVYKAYTTTPTNWSNGSDLAYDGAPYIVSTDADYNYSPFANTTGGEVVFSYTSAGKFIGTLTGAFLLGKVFFGSPNLKDNGANKRFVEVFRVNNNSFGINTYKIDAGSNRVDEDGVLSFTSISFKINP